MKGGVAELLEPYYMILKNFWQKKPNIIKEFNEKYNELIIKNGI